MGNGWVVGNGQWVIRTLHPDTVMSLSMCTIDPISVQLVIKKCLAAVILPSGWMYRRIRQSELKC